MSLRDYHHKRKFSATPEPKGSVKESTGPLTFVIQMHEASRLHYDFRLECNGVLKSWAVPKGPSLKPGDKRLAVMVEDHPIDYAQFEGIIPKGNYGAGTVMVWDKGVYSPIAFVDRKQAQVVISEQINEGHLTFIMLGEKLNGEFALVKTKSSDENAWLLFKAADEYASTKDVLRQDTSVLTGRTMAEIEKEAVKKGEIWLSKPESSTPKTKMPHNISPMLAHSVDEPFDNDDWLFEIKYDGYRAIAEIAAGNVSLYSRKKLSYNEKFSVIKESLEKFPADAVLDGEIVVVDSSGKPQFQWLQEYPENTQGELLYYVFDMLYYDGRDLTGLPLSQRKELLKDVLPPLPGVVYAEHIRGTGISMFQQTQKLKMEGIMAKDANSTYVQGERSNNWLKIKSLHREEVVIAGFTKPKGGRKYFGALIAGMYEHGKLAYVGHVGGGFDEAKLKSIYQKLLPLVQDDCPFENVPQTNAPATWVTPEVLAEVTFSQWTRDKQMRHPIFLGLREDKEDNDKKIIIDKQPVKLTNLEKIFWPQEGFTKGDLLHYYEEIAPVILPHLKDRPESLLRYPNGITGKNFYQKDAERLDADWIEKVSVHSESNNKNISYLICQNQATLLYLINLGCIDLNPWSSRVGTLEYPDYLIIDLDPEAIDFASVVKVALAARETLEQFDIPSYPKTSGAKGMHIYIPLGATYTYEQSRNLAELLCLQIHHKIPHLTSMKRNPKDRQGLVYLDYLQNIQGQTLASVYSVRAQPGASVSTPLLWSEVTTKIHPSQFTMHNTLSRLQKHGDLFKAALGKGIEMEKILKNISNTIQ